MAPRNLDPAEVRVLGALIEKDLSTPDHYPLSLNSLVSACNQSSNRDPVITLAPDAVSHAIDTLRRQDLVRSFQGSGERVPKYQHLLAQATELSRAELAVLSVLMLRGAQTLAEVRSRAARLLPGDDADAVESALHALVAREPDAPVVRLPRRPGQKELRYMHLLGGEPVADGGALDERDHDAQLEPTVATSGAEDRIAALESLAQDLVREVADLRAQLEWFRQQFE